MKNITFSTVMVQAILDGKKTQTRRIIKISKKPFLGNFYHPFIFKIEKHECSISTSYAYDFIQKHAKYLVGDILWGWIPSILMPQKASRIFLKIVDVRVERVQDISMSDAIAEGVMALPDDFYSLSLLTAEKSDQESYFTERFEELWDSINAKRGFGWNVNPLVWVYEFERVDSESILNQEQK